VRLEIGKQETFSVDAKLEWNPSGIDMKAGEQYSIKVTILEEWKDANTTSSLSKGWNPPARWIEWLVRRKARAPHLPMYSLVGSLDEDSATFFLIGEAARLQVPKDGALQAFANDWPGRYLNNHGRVDVVVERLAV